VTVNVLSWPLANAAARGLGHLPGAIREFGVMRLVECQRCGMSAIENTGDGRGVTGQLVDKPCGGKK